VAAQTWPSVAPLAVERLFDQLRHYPADATTVADAVVELSAEYPDVLHAFADSLVTNAKSADKVAAAEVVSLLGIEDPAIAKTHSDQLLDWATEPGNTATAEALVELIQIEDGWIITRKDRLQRTLETKGLPPAQWAAIATILGLIVAETGESESIPQAKWLRKRFPEHPLVFGPALATLVGAAPSVALPPLEGLLATVQRFGQRCDVDPERILEEVITPLVGSHPVAAIPLISTLCSILESGTVSVEPATRRRALALLDRTLNQWPYLAPLAQEALDCCLDSPDDELLSQLPEILARWQLKETDTLDRLDRHPTTAVRVSATRAKRRAAARDTDPPPVATVDVTAPDAETVDSVARWLSPQSADQPQAVLETLEVIGEQHPDLRSRCVVHVVGYLAATVASSECSFADAAAETALETLSTLTPNDTGDDTRSPQSSTTAHAVGSTLLSCTDAADPLVSAQALSAVGIVAQNNPEELAASAVAHAETALDRSNQLVKIRALVVLRRLADHTPGVVAPQRLEGALFRPHSVVPTAIWTLGEVAIRQPEAAETVAESVPGLLEWSVLDSQHAGETILQLLAADPDLDSLYAPVLLEQLADDGQNASPTLLKQVGLLSAETIAETNGGVDALLGYLYASEGEGDQYLDESLAIKERTLVADRLYRVAQIAPERLLGALKDEEVLPRIHANDALYLLATWVHLARYDHRRMDYPCIDAMATLDVVDEYDGLDDLSKMDFKHPSNHSADQRTLQHAGIELLGVTGHEAFATVLEEYRSEEPPVSPSPDLVRTFLLRCEARSVREDLVDVIAAHGPLSLRRAVLDQLLDRLETAPIHRRKRIIEILPGLLAGLSDPTKRSRGLDAVHDALADEWNVRLVAVESIAALGSRGAVSKTWAIDRLQEALGDSDPAVRTNAAEELTELCLDSVLDLEPVVDELCAAVTSGTALGHRGRIVALGGIGAGEPSVRDRICRVLAATLDANDPQLRQRAVEAMSELAAADPTVVDNYLTEIGPLVTDPAPPVQEAATDCLERIGSHESTATVCQYLSEILTHDDPEIRRNALETLQSLSQSAPERVANYSEQIIQFVSGPRTAESITAIKCLEYIITMTEYEGTLARSHRNYAAISRSARYRTGSGKHYLRHWNTPASEWENEPQTHSSPSPKPIRTSWSAILTSSSTPTSRPQCTFGPHSIRVSTRQQPNLTTEKPCSRHYSGCFRCSTKKHKLNSVTCCRSVPTNSQRSQPNTQRISGRSSGTPRRVSKKTVLNCCLQRHQYLRFRMQSSRSWSRSPGKPIRPLELRAWSSWSISPLPTPISSRRFSAQFVIVLTIRRSEPEVLPFDCSAWSAQKMTGR